MMFRTVFSGSVLTALTAALVTLLAPVPAAYAADEALLVGVDEYPGLRPGSNLGGCVNDARMMADKLKLYGFQVTQLSNAEANKAGILAAIAKAKSRLGPRDRFAFYFAGHGTVGSNGESVLLTYSSKDDNESGDIQTDELYQAVRSLPARAKTILLDSCHSGGMVRSVGGLTGRGRRRARVYIRSKVLNRGSSEKAWQKIKVNGADDITDTTKGGGVCYFTAALKTQVANETEIEGTRHGIFTFNLAQKLNGQKDLWEDISAAVSAGVMDATEGEQKPVLGPNAYLKTSLFEGSAGGGNNPKPNPNPAPPTPPGTTTLDKLYNLSQPDLAKLKLTMEPETSPVKVGQNVHFTVTVGAEGYLVVVNRDPEGKLEVIWPNQGQAAEGAAVKVGQTIRIPEGADEAMTPDAAGTDGLKAILFTRKEAAQALLSAFNGEAIVAKEANKAWKKVSVPTAPFYTSELITQIIGR